MSDSNYLILGIDGSNLLRGGGLTHLCELLKAADPVEAGFKEVVLWARQSVLDQVDSRPWLIKSSPSALEGGALRRTVWQRWHLPKVLRESGCHILWAPGGNHSGSFHPVVTMSQNMQPFEWQELRRHGWSLHALRLLLLRFTQIRSFKDCDGLIFLTHYAQREVGRVTGSLNARTAVIPHGRSHLFDHPPRPQRAIQHYSPEKPYRLLYVSIINHYKHQWHVVEAVGRIRQQTGWPLHLDLIGPSHSPALPKLQNAIKEFDPDGSWVTYHGAVSYDDLPSHYRVADLGIFASSCENLPIILIENMAAGLPIACSNRGPMPEIFGPDGTYFNPESPTDIQKSLTRLIADPLIRLEKAQDSYRRSLDYHWSRCAYETLMFLADLAKTHELN